MAHLNHRLDAIEERFNEALGQVVQRSDLDGLKLIEAHVIELAAHVEQTRGRLDRIDAIDDQMQGLARRLEEGDHQRLDALEKLLQDYVAEWRKGDERTASALRSLEDVVSRVGESIEAMEAQKPATGPVALAARHSGPRASPRSKAIRSRRFTPMRPACWSRLTHRAPLDAADYAPRAEPDCRGVGDPLPREGFSPPADQHETKPARRRGAFAVASRAR